LVFAVGCATHIHTVGTGARSGQSEQTRQWYVLWGLVPLNDVDTNAMAGGSANYEIKTSSTFMDAIIGGVTGMVTVNCRTVKVTR
tara:strand:- start:379 stop:633 length:255 start_codon:yes stop_codon:yes gene_type:complete